MIRQTIRPAQKFRLTVIAAGCIGIIVFFIVFLTGNFKSEKVKASGGMHGSKTVSTSNVRLNEFAVLTSNAAAGSNFILTNQTTLNSNSRFSGNLCAGELILIIQMQGADIDVTNSSSYGAILNYNNCGLFEFAQVSSIPSATRINLTAPLKNSYTSSGKVQVVRVPRYSSFTVTSGGSVSTDGWNGSTGGIIAIESNSTMIINGTIRADGKGFRGGELEEDSYNPGNRTVYRSTDPADGGEKGESIAGYQGSYTNGRYGRGAPANGGGGGNAHNASGGGGANGGNIAGWNGNGNPDTSVAAWKTAWNFEAANFHKNVSSGGGRGGYTFSQKLLNPLSVGPGNSSWQGDHRYNMGGFGGRPLNVMTGRIFMGGGGGAGDSNNGTGTSGGDGGGIIFLLAANGISGTGTIQSEGNDVSSTTGPRGRDGSGGGGGGGTIVCYSKQGNVSLLNLRVEGGKGGNQDLTTDEEAEGPGGGGGGGVIAVTSPVSLTVNINGGLNGTSNSSGVSNFIPNGATKGGIGSYIVIPVGLNPYSGSNVLAVKLLYFNAEQVKNKVELRWATSAEKDNDYFTLERSANGVAYTKIGTVKGNGNSTSIHEYKFTDQEPISGISYYRLRQTDYDGTTEIFNPVRMDIRRMKPGKMIEINSMFPNPCNDFIKVEVESEVSQKLEVRISRLDGSKIFSQETSANAGFNTIQVNTGSLNPGAYMLTVITADEELINRKLVKN